MRPVIWETSGGALVAFLNSAKQVYMADLFTITLTGGSVLRYTSADVAVYLPGVAGIFGGLARTWAIGPVIKRGVTKVAVGIAVNTLDVTLAADQSITVNGVPLLPFIASGGLDGARFELNRAFAADPGSPWIGVLRLFVGRVSEVPRASRYEAALSIASDSELLNVMIPRNVYQPGCANTLFDGTCGMSKTAAAVTATATATSASRTVFATGLAQAAGYFSLGWAVGVTGANAGIGRTIKLFSGGSITTIQPWPAGIAAGDTFTVYPGCDKTQATCNTKFSNLARFRGHPYVPAPETVL